MIHDGLWDPYGNVHMGDCAELCAREKKITRAAQDAFAAESYRRALAAQAEGTFDAEIVAVEVPQRKGPPTVVDADEEPGKRRRRASWRRCGPPSRRTAPSPPATPRRSTTARAALVLAAADVAGEARAGQPLARIVGAASHAQAPEWFTTAPGRRRSSGCCKRPAGRRGDVDLWEINEAFAVVSRRQQPACWASTRRG